MNPSLPQINQGQGAVLPQPAGDNDPYSTATIPLGLDNPALYGHNHFSRLPPQVFRQFDYVMKTASWNFDLDWRVSRVLAPRSAFWLSTNDVARQYQSRIDALKTPNQRELLAAQSSAAEELFKIANKFIVDCGAAMGLPNDRIPQIRGNELNKMFKRDKESGAVIMKPGLGFPPSARARQPTSSYDANLTQRSGGSRQADLPRCPPGCIACTNLFPPSGDPDFVPDRILQPLDLEGYPLQPRTSAFATAVGLSLPDPSMMTGAPPPSSQTGAAAAEAARTATATAKGAPEDAHGANTAGNAGTGSTGDEAMGGADIEGTAPGNETVGDGAVRSGEGRPRTDEVGRLDDDDVEMLDVTVDLTNDSEAD